MCVSYYSRNTYIWFQKHLGKRFLKIIGDRHIFPRVEGTIPFALNLYTPPEETAL